MSERVSPPLSLDALEKAAKEVHPLTENEPWFGDAIRPVNEWTVLEADARFIAAASPDTILALVAVVRAAQGLLDAHKSFSRLGEQQGIESLAAALARFKEDAHE